MIKSKHVSFIIITCLALTVACKATEKSTNASMSSKTYSYLALGDSYTIGEGVDELHRYPNQVVELLKSEKITFTPPTIIAKTGWTTDELVAGIESTNLPSNQFDLVTLLIGVNNQYRGRSVANYEGEFENLLDLAIGYAGGNVNHVVVLSIPDWGITPFATSRNVDQKTVGEEINSYNTAKEKICKIKGVHFIDITEGYRKTGASTKMLVSDNLHPSGMVYKEWAEKIAAYVSHKMDF